MIDEREIAGSGDWLEEAPRLESWLRGARGGVAWLRVVGGEVSLASPVADPVALVDLWEPVAKSRERVALLVAHVAGRIEGPALSLALSADLLFVEEDMVGRLLEWQDRPLLLPGDITTLQARLGRSRALEVALLGGDVTARELLARGSARPASQASDMHARLTSRSLSVSALTLACRLGRRARGGGSASLALERASFALATSGPDLLEGLAAFRERRPPSF